MMNSLAKYFIFSFSLLLIVSCKEDKLDLYEVDKTGNNIYFADKFDKLSNDVLDKNIGFGTFPSSVKDYVVPIPIRIAGVPVPEDRLVSVKFADTSSMKEGIHFRLDSTPKIRANRLQDTIFLRLLRAEDILTKKVYLHMELLPNQDFRTDIKTFVNTAGKQDLLNYTISSNDMLPVPGIWLIPFLSTTAKDYLGPYSRKKGELMIEVLGLDPVSFYNPTAFVYPHRIANWGVLMKKWLQDEEKAGRVYYDENNNKITVGPKA